MVISATLVQLSQSATEYIQMHTGGSKWNCRISSSGITIKRHNTRLHYAFGVWTASIAATKGSRVKDFTHEDIVDAYEGLRANAQSQVDWMNKLLEEI